tara:strand:- start:38391 stop:38888 length:498 start_codon:yes stop_codon:yes gene_type:complete
MKYKKDELVWIKDGVEEQQALSIGLFLTTLPIQITNYNKKYLVVTPKVLPDGKFQYGTTVYTRSGEKVDPDNYSEKDIELLAKAIKALSDFNTCYIRYVSTKVISAVPNHKLHYEMLKVWFKDYKFKVFPQYSIYDSNNLLQRNSDRFMTWAMKIIGIKNANLQN